MTSQLQAGDPARNIHVWTTDSSKFSLFTATEASPVLLLFFPCAFTKHENKVRQIAAAAAARVTERRTVQILNSVNDKYSKLFKTANVRIVGISTDTHWTLAAYKEQKNIRFELASDFNKEAAKAYGILIDKYSSYGYNGIAKEACFLIAYDKYAASDGTRGTLIHDFAGPKGKTSSST